MPMNNYNAVVKSFNFSPMVEVIPSILYVTFYVPLTQESVTIDFQGTIPQLSQRFGFKIENDRTWDFAGFEGRKCVLQKIDGKFRFIRFVYEN